MHSLQKPSISIIESLLLPNYPTIFFYFSDAIRTIAESVKIPIIANGGSLDIQDFSDIMKFKEDCGAASVMVARAAQKNVSIFRKEGAI